MKFKANLDLLFSRGEVGDPRLGDIAQMPSFRAFEKSNWDVALIGFPDDRGILLNRGRAGANEGPDAIRKWFYRLVPSRQDQRIADLGNMEMSDSLEADHASAVEAIAAALGHATRVCILGGGHDWGFSPIAALMQGGETGFVNIDAHLDVRPSASQHSGTSFWRALESGVTGVNAKWVGVQKASAARAHLDYVDAKGGCVTFADERVNRIAPAACANCELCDISLDMDVFAMSSAPGVSAPQPTGLQPEAVLEFLKNTLSDTKVRTFGIYELSPANDVNEMTARLAARCLWEAVALTPTKEK